VSGAIVDNLRSDPNSFGQILGLKAQGNRVLEKVKVFGAGHSVADNSFWIALSPALFGAGKEFSPGARHVAILASLSRLLPAVGTSQPFPERIVNHGIPKNSEMAWGAELAALLKL
jgi:hypothetical protein